MASDSEMIKLCAERCGLQYYTSRMGVVFAKDYYPESVSPRDAPWNPLLYSDQAFHLIEDFGIMIWPPRFNAGGKDWVARIEDKAGNVLSQAVADDLKRAVVKCVALKQIEFRDNKGAVQCRT